MPRLAANALGGGTVTTGRTDRVDPQWINFVTNIPDGTRHLYAFSGELTAVPEPSAFAFIGVAGLVLFGVIRKRRLGKRV